MATQEYKPTGKVGLYDLEERINEINANDDILQKILRVVDFAIFRPLLEKATLNGSKTSNVGAKPYDPVLMFKILVLQQTNGLSDDKIEHHIKDRLSFQQFLGLTIGDKVPDSKSIWLFREKIVQAELTEELFSLFRDLLKEQNMILNEGKTIDATMVSVPKQRNSPEVNAEIKAGNGKDLWQSEPNKKRQKDVDARWTKKGSETFFGYKNHTKICNKSKLIDSYTVTDASVHDSQALDTLLDETDKGQTLHADSAYVGENQEATIAKYEMTNCVHEKGYKKKPLTEEQKESNRIKSQIRCRVEHVYAFVTLCMSDYYIRSIGIKRNSCALGLINLTYNMCRYEQILRLGFKQKVKEKKVKVN